MADITFVALGSLSALTIDSDELRTVAFEVTLAATVLVETAVDAKLAAAVEAKSEATVAVTLLVETVSTEEAPVEAKFATAPVLTEAADAAGRDTAELGALPQATALGGGNVVVAGLLATRKVTPDGYVLMLAM